MYIILCTYLFVRTYDFMHGFFVHPFSPEVLLLIHLPIYLSCLQILCISACFIDYISYSHLVYPFSLISTRPICLFAHVSTFNGSDMCLFQKQLLLLF